MSLLDRSIVALKKHKRGNFENQIISNILQVSSQLQEDIKRKSQLHRIFQTNSIEEKLTLINEQIFTRWYLKQAQINFKKFEPHSNEILIIFTKKLKKIYELINPFLSHSRRQIWDNIFDPRTQNRDQSILYLYIECQLAWNQKEKLLTLFSQPSLDREDLFLLLSCALESKDKQVIEHFLPQLLEMNIWWPHVSSSETIKILQEKSILDRNYTTLSNLRCDRFKSEDLINILQCFNIFVEENYHLPHWMIIILETDHLKAFQYVLSLPHQSGFDLSRLTIRATELQSVKILQYLIDEWQVNKIKIIETIHELVSKIKLSSQIIQLYLQIKDGEASELIHLAYLREEFFLVEYLLWINPGKYYEFFGKLRDKDKNKNRWINYLTFKNNGRMGIIHKRKIAFK